MKLFLIHVGFYDPAIMDGIYEQHSNYFVTAENINDAKRKARKKSIYKMKKMHIDGIQEINIVDGYRITLQPENKENDYVSYGYDTIKNLPE